MELQRPEAPPSSAFGTFSRQREKEKSALYENKKGSQAKA
jgi:hypothetical protein